MKDEIVKIEIKDFPDEMQRQFLVIATYLGDSFVGSMKGGVMV